MSYYLTIDNVLLHMVLFMIAPLIIGFIFTLSDKSEKHSAWGILSLILIAIIPLIIYGSLWYFSE